MEGQQKDRCVDCGLEQNQHRQWSGIGGIEVDCMEERPEVYYYAPKLPRIFVDIRKTAMEGN